MHSATVAALEQLGNASWFSRVGIEDTQVPIILSSWHQAIEYCGSVKWENLSLEAANQLRVRILDQSRERYAEWNRIAIEVLETVAPFVDKKIETVVRENGLPNVFIETVRWDIIHLCMESEYSDVSEPGFYSDLAYWYLAGHFPCGWSGEYPNGLLVVY